MGELIRLLLFLGITVTHVTAVDFAIIADDRFDQNGTIFRAPMANLQSMAPIPLYGLINPVAIDYDPVRRLIYWSDHGDASMPPFISRANLDGTSQTILYTGVGVINGLSIDYLENVLYWTETNNQRIMKAGAQPGSGPVPQAVVSSNLTRPQDVVVDPAGRKLFWTDWGLPTNGRLPKIERLELDNTTKRRVLIDGANHPGVQEPYGLSLDFEEQRLYFCDPMNNSIYLSDLEGYGLHNLIEIVSPEIKPFDVAFYSNNVYWTDKAIPALIEAERYQGLYARIAGPFIFHSANSLIIHTDTDRSCYDGNPCMNGGRCRQFIVGYKCVCIQPYTGDNCEISSDNSCYSNGGNPCKNDGECNQFATGFECLCKTGYSGPTCDTRSFLIVADTATSQIWTAPIPIKRGAVYTEVPIPNNTSAPKALDYNPTDDRIFWSDNFTISSIKRNGTDQQVVIANIGEVQGIALDLMNNKLYWTDRIKQTIARSNLDGSGNETIFSDLGQPWNIIVDPAGKYIYWTDIEKESHLRTIERATLDGNEYVTLIPVNLFQPLALQADFSVNQLFFGDALVNKIETCDLDGRNRRVLIQLRQTDSHPFDIGLYQDIIYWSDNNLKRMVALNRYGSTDGALLVGPEQFTQAAGMVIYEGNDGSCDTTPCLNGGRCRQLPVGYQCVCAGTGYIGDTCQTSTDNSCISNPCQNGARCEQLATGYKCVCLYGYSGETCNTEDVMYIADQANGTIYSAPMRTLTFNPVLQNLSSPVAIRYDNRDQKVYWADNVTNKVERMNADGTNREVVIETGLMNPTGLSIDRANRMIYITDIGANNIKRVSMDGNIPAVTEIFVDTEIMDPQHIVVDWRNNYVYWTNNQTDSVRIERMNTDKTGREIVINNTLPDNIPRSARPWMRYPFGLTIDYAEEVLYWGDLLKNKICSFDLVTKEQKIVLDRGILKDTVIHPFDIIVYGEYLYWSDIIIGGLVESNRRFPVALSVGSVVFGNPGGLDIYYSLPACWAEPCKNGGTCTDLPDTASYTCACTAGYTGVHCQIEINECDPNPCMNDGLCQDELNGFTCYCDAGITGRICETDIDECASTPPICRNNANCTTPEVNEVICECPLGICGDRCEKQCPPVCDSNPCLNDGTCTEPIPFMWACECPPYTTGDNCGTEIDPCSTYPCQNGATCRAAVFDYYACNCAPGWMGQNCDQDIPECVSAPCLNGATCFEGTNSYFCHCQVGFTGIICATNINECLSDPCLNRGICMDLVNGYRCDCPPYYIGDYCEIPIASCPDPDESPLCENGGTCIDRGGGFSVCICPETFAGDRCERADFCLSNPCLNGGNCTSLSDRYTCKCYDGFTGTNCENDYDECISLPCKNGGTCSNLASSYACSCTDEWRGPNCQTAVITVSCDDDPPPCQNGATCEGRSGAGNIKCICADGFSGDRCEINNNECRSNPCQNNGRCIDNINAFMCRCPAPYKGDKCQDVNGCVAHRLKNGYLYPEKLVYGLNEKVSFLCGNGYTLKGATEATCSDDGWSNDAPECVISSGATAGNVAVAVGGSFGVAIALFLLILILLAVIYFVRESQKSTPEDRQVVEYTNQHNGGTDGDGFESVQIGPAVDENTADTAPIQPKDEDE
ncbi:uncharacterized protein [Amphiura filiformis]|uniref:uncharacterized protein n=1 Tax=Amphiura filiformis TaxID=82378 RepID=UPI003B2163DD